ncbi:MAG: hypothetical protein JWM47_4509 [Acidimicrobiales bacterium]|nr:hypothetical protein [Acidimicrobiales bacterium]
MGQSASLTPDQIAAVREKAFYERGVEMAERGQPLDYIENGDGVMWVPGGTRGSAKQFFAGQYGVAFIDVRCRQEYMRVSFSAIRDRAHDMAWDDGYEDHDVPYTWEGEGWTWEVCEPGDDRCVFFWRCEETDR